MSKLSLKQFTPHIISIITFLVITLLFFHPMVFEGKVMSQNDVLQGISSGQEVKEYRLRTGNEALWTNSMFGGMPAYLINVIWSGDLSKHFHDLFSLYLPSPARYTFLAMLCFYILLLTFGVNPYLALSGGIVYGLNSFFMVSIEAGHIWKVSAIAYMPLVLAGVNLILRDKKLLGIGLTGLAVALQIRSNHVQISYYLFLTLLVFWIVYLVDAIRNKAYAKFLRTTAFIVIGGLLGIMANVGKLWTSLEYSPYTIRGKSELSTNTQSTSGGLDRDYAFAWSNGIAESLTFFVPYFQGGASGENVGMKSNLAEELRNAGVNENQIRNIAQRAPTYWGDQPFTSGPIYTGIVAMFLLVLSFQVLKGPLRNWLTAAIILGFVLSWGKNFETFNYFMFDYFPLYNKFRAVSMTLVIPLLCIPIMGFVGLSEYLKKPESKVLVRSGFITSGILILILIASAMMDFRSPNDAAITQDFFLNALVKERTSLLRGSAFRSLIVVIVVLGVLYYHFLGKIKYSVLFTIIGLVIFIDLYTISNKYISSEKFTRRNDITVYKPDGADSRILQDESHYRVANLTANIFNDAFTSYFHSSIGGYHGAKLRRYQDLIDVHLGNEIQSSIGQIRERNFEVSGIPVMNMLNTKYFKIGNTENAVLANRNAFGNAWFVDEIKKVNSPDEAIDLIGKSDLRSTVISEELDNEENLSKGVISLVDYEPNRLLYSATNDSDGFAVFSEIYYAKGWKAYVDGQESQIHQVNYVLRGLEIPSGDHEIEFRFEPSSYKIGNSIMWIGSVLCIGLFFFGLYSEIRSIKS